MVWRRLAAVGVHIFSLTGTLQATFSSREQKTLLKAGDVYHAELMQHLHPNKRLTDSETKQEKKKDNLIN